MRAGREGRPARHQLLHRLDGLARPRARPGVSKASGLASVCERLGVAADDVLAIGDGRNDIEMLRWAGRGVAMGQAPLEVQEAADDVTAHRQDDGVRPRARPLVPGVSRRLVATDLDGLHCLVGQLDEGLRPVGSDVRPTPGGPSRRATALASWSCSDGLDQVVAEQERVAAADRREDQQRPRHLRRTRRASVSRRAAAGVGCAGSRPIAAAYLRPGRDSSSSCWLRRAPAARVPTGEDQRDGSGQPTRCARDAAGRHGSLGAAPRVHARGTSTTRREPARAAPRRCGPTPTGDSAGGAGRRPLASDRGPQRRGRVDRSTWSVQACDQRAHAQTPLRAARAVGEMPFEFTRLV